MPPVSGVYAFWIASDDGGELSLSSDNHPENKVRECFVPWLTGVREWNKFQEQKSPSIQLEADEAYYFEVSPAIIFAALHFATSITRQRNMQCHECMHIRQTTNMLRWIIMHRRHMQRIK